MKDPYKKNRYTYGIGTIGRDMQYTLISMFYMFYLTDVLKISVQDLAWVTGIIVGLRIFDALSDPVMGIVVDNTHTRHGKFKPWIAIGAFLSGIMTILLFVNSGLQGPSFVLAFAISYLLWGLTYTVNDISYWSMLPSLSKDKNERENIGSKARIFALVGTFIVVAGIVPLTDILGRIVGGTQRGYFVFAVIVIAIMWLGQCVTLFGVREPKGVDHEPQHTGIKGLAKAIFGNDQLLIVAISMTLFMIGYLTTVSFGIFYFQYVYGDQNMYSIFAIILGISQIASLAIFPVVSKRLKRKTIYFFATVLVVLGYILFFFAPAGTMVFVGIAGVLIFVGQAGIQLLMLLFLADTVEYGHWKLRKRNESITFSLQPFINKVGAALASGIVGTTVILSGIQADIQAETTHLLTGQGLFIFKAAMFILPLICILAGFLINHFKFTLNEEKYTDIIAELKERGEI